MEITTMLTIMFWVGFGLAFWKVEGGVNWENVQRHDKAAARLQVRYRRYGLLRDTDQVMVLAEAF